MTNALYYVDDLTGVAIKHYYRFDTKLSYALTDNIDLSLVGQNLFNSGHQEFSPFTYRSAAEVGRSIYSSISIKF